VLLPSIAHVCILQFSCFLCELLVSLARVLTPLPHFLPHLDCELHLIEAVKMYTHYMHINYVCLSNTSVIRQHMNAVTVTLKLQIYNFVKL
jgi:hypothetical protein